MKKAKQLQKDLDLTVYYVYGYNKGLFTTESGKPIYKKGNRLCSTWNIAKALHVYATESQLNNWDCVILFQGITKVAEHEKE